MYKARKRKGGLKDPDAPVEGVAFGGDGSTYDIGFQWLSGAMERGHDFTYICLDMRTMQVLVVREVQLLLLELTHLLAQAGSNFIIGKEGRKNGKGFR